MQVRCPICNGVREVKTANISEAVCRSCAQKIKKTYQVERKCKFCGELFTPQVKNQLYCKRTHYRTCPICGKDYIEDNADNLKRPPVACSYSCRAKATQQTSLKLYGCKAPGNNPEAREKAKQTMMNRFGVAYTLQSSVLKEQVEHTNKIKYGVANPASNVDVIIKRMQTNKDKYGDTMPFNSAESLSKAKKTLLERYGVASGFLTPQSVLKKVSKLNLEFASKLDKYGIRYELEYRIDNRFYDFYLPDSNMLIEINPTYTHSILNDNVDKYYHRDKMSLARSKGFQCMFMWDWDNPTLFIRALMPKTCIEASNLEVYKLNTEAANAFFKDNHLQSCRREPIFAVGFIHEGKIIQAISLCKPTYASSHVAQISRMCTSPEYDVVGGYDKLTTYLSEMGLHDTIAYADLSKTDGSELESLGLVLDHVSPPRLIWSKGVKYVSSSLVVSGRSIYHSEEEFLENGWLPIYDCGQSVYEFKAMQ